MSDAEIEELIEGGRNAWEQGAPVPSMPKGDNIFTPEALYWMGYMFERGRDFFRRRKMALYPDTVEFRP